MLILCYSFLAWFANGIPRVFLDTLNFVGFVEVEMLFLAHPAKLVKAFCETLVTCAALTLVFELCNIMIYFIHSNCLFIINIFIFDNYEKAESSLLFNMLFIYSS